MLLAIFAPFASALESTTGQHLEVTPEFDESTGQWVWFAVSDESNLPLSNLYFSGKDAPANQGGIRVNRASDSKWDFIGVGAGEPFWRFRDVIVGTPGFGETQSSLSASPLHFRLHSVNAPAGGAFSLYFSNTNPTVHFRTDNGIDASDLFPKDAAHTHQNWAFTKKGLWIVNLTVQGILNTTGQLTPISAPQPLAFAIGDFAAWKAARFSMDELLDPMISGNDADPDKDGWSNLMEYALGGDCRSASQLRESDMQPMAPQLLPPATGGGPWRFRYFRRIAAKDVDVSYVVESSPSLAPQSWASETGNEQILNSNDSWEQVQIDLAPSQNHFARLKVMEIP